MSIDQTARRGTGYDVRSLAIGAAAIVVLTGVAAAVLWWAWDDLPERVATHWSGNGEPDEFTDLGRGLATMLLALPAGIAFGLAVLMGFVPRTAPGTRWISALPVGLAAAILTVTVGSTVQQRNGGEASLAITLLLMLIAGVAATAAVVPLFPHERIEPVVDPPPAGAPRLDTTADVWWTGTAPMSPTLVGGLVALCLVPGIVIAATTRIGWVVALILVLPALLVIANGRFRVTIGSGHVVTSGALIGWPKLTLPLETIAEASTERVSIWEYGGMGLRYGPRGTGVITRGGEALILTRGDGSRIAITVDDAATAAATVNTLRSRSTA